MSQSLFEVHTLKGGQWVIDSTYPGREAAIEVAKQLYGEKTFEAIKVIKDTYDSATGQGKEIVVYDSAKSPRPKAPPPAAKEDAPAPKPAVAAGGKKKKPANKDVSVALKAMGWLVVILIGGLGVLFLLTKAGDLFNKGF